MVQTTKYAIRFNPDGECRSVAIDFVMYYFYGFLLNKETIVSIANISQMVSFFQEKDLEVLIKVPWLSYISPYYWKFILQNFDNIVSYRTFLRKKDDAKGNKVKQCILQVASAKDLYGIHGKEWSHFVIKYKDKDGNYRCFDPLVTHLSIHEKENIKYKDVDAVNFSWKFIIYKKFNQDLKHY